MFLPINCQFQRQGAQGVLQAAVRVIRAEVSPAAVVYKVKPSLDGSQFRAQPPQRFPQHVVGAVVPGRVVFFIQGRVVS